jgi:hypothetical protein
MLTTDPNDEKLSKARPDGQQEAYLVLSDEERAKGFVRPVRRSYIHVGFGGFETNPNDPSKPGLRGNGCGVMTTMAQAIAETYARDPGYYGATFCHGCGQHFPVGEFKWADTDEVVGS